jgi:antitoxin HicB
MNKKDLKKMVDYYTSLKYPIKLKEMGEGGYFVEVLDLPGCMCDADTLEEIPIKLEKAKRAWIEGTLERGGEIPSPKSDELYSGRFVVRMAKSLHRTLSESARKEGVSLNSYVCTLLSQNYERARIQVLVDEIKGMIISSYYPWKVGGFPSIKETKQGLHETLYAQGM